MDPVETSGDGSIKKQNLEINWMRVPFMEFSKLQRGHQWEMLWFKDQGEVYIYFPATKSIIQL